MKTNTNEERNIKGETTMTPNTTTETAMDTRQSTIPQHTKEVGMVRTGITRCVLMAAAVFATSMAVSADPVILVKASQTWSDTGGDDLAALKRLASGIGWDFQPNGETDAKLKELGIKYIRCINVDPLPGRFDEAGAFIVEGDTSRLDAHLKSCRDVGASPHICFGMGVPKELQIASDKVKKDMGVMGQQAGDYCYWNGDKAKLKAHAKAYFDYVLVKNKFPEARFEVGNEPDIDGQFPRNPGPKLAMGSAKLYEEYFGIYSLLAEAAAEFERERNIKVRIGGPAASWAFTFRFGGLNWADRFIRDCAAQKTKIDFIGLHYYGNISSLDGEYKGSYPHFTEMLKRTRGSRDTFLPGVPLIFTEWGPSYVTDNTAKAAVNADHVGAAWAAEFLRQMLVNGVESSLYLVTTDQPAQPGGEFKSIRGWPSLFVTPCAFGKPYPKPMYHVFKMLSQLEGARVESTRYGSIGSFVAAQGERRVVRALIWNYAAIIPEGAASVETASKEGVTLRVRDAGAFFKGAQKVKMSRWLLCKGSGDDSWRLENNQLEPKDFREDILVDNATLTVLDGELDCCFSMPPSSVSLVELSPAE